MIVLRTLGASLLLAGLLLLPAAASADSFLHINDTLANGVVNLSWGQGQGLCSGCILTSVFVNGQAQGLAGSLDFTDGTQFSFNGSWTVPQGGYTGSTFGTAYFFDQTDPSNTSDILHFDTHGSQDGFSGFFSGDFISETTEGSLGLLPVADPLHNIGLFYEGNDPFNAQTFNFSGLGFNGQA